MSPAFVMDCSITMAWCFSDEATPAALKIQARLRDEIALVPAFWFLEVANVLAMAEKRKRSTPADSAEFLALLMLVNIEIDSEATARAFNHVLPLCRKHGLTSYDAAYLELAHRRGLPLATLDRELRVAARSLEIGLLDK